MSPLGATVPLSYRTVGVFPAPTAAPPPPEVQRRGEGLGRWTHIYVSYAPGAASYTVPYGTGMIYSWTRQSLP